MGIITVQLFVIKEKK